MALIALIRPPVVVAKWAHTTPTCPPIGLAYVAGALREAGHEVRVIDSVGAATEQFLPTPDRRFLSHGLSADEIVARIPPAPDAITFSIMFSHEWPLIRGIIDAVRARFPNVPIIAGGEHVTALGEFSLEQCRALDACVYGEGEETLIELLDALLGRGQPLEEIRGVIYRGPGGNAVRTAARARIRAIDDISPPAWDLFPLEQYLDKEYGFGVNRGRSMPVLATRGCPYQCTFCSNPQMWGTRWVARNVDMFFKEMLAYRQQYKIDNFDFYDLTAIVKRDWIVRFCKGLIESGANFTWQLPSGTRSEAIDAEVAQLLFRSGCRNISYAPESGSPAVLQRIKKKIKLDAMMKSMRGAIRAGINVKANIIIGFPGETHGEVWETLKFCCALALLGVHDMSISPFSPYPGSELFDDMRRRRQIADLTDDYFYGLAAYTDLSTTISCSEHIGDRALGTYRLIGMASFYLLQYAARPWRMIRTFKNVLGKHQESRLEMSLRDLLIRLTRSGHRESSSA